MRFLRFRHSGHTLFAAFLLLTAPICVLPQGASGVPPAAEKESERETLEFEGMRIVFPKGEADVVELLKPALKKYREERRSAADEEAKAITGCLSAPEQKEKLRELVAAYTARDSVGEEFDARWAAQATTMRALANAWRTWSGDLSELQLWRREELGPFQTRPDGSDDAEGYCYEFPEIAYGKNGARFSLRAPFASPLVGLDMMLKLGRATKPLRLDFPLLYKPGESAEEIAKYGRGFLEQLPVTLRKDFLLGPGLMQALAKWTFENLLLGEVEATVVERRTAEETALADGIARVLLFAQILQQAGEKKTTEEFSNLFPFGMGGWDQSDPAAILSTLEKVEPLEKVDRANVTERIFARNLIALALLEIAQKDAAGPPIPQKLKKAGVAIPAGGFTMDSFCAAVDAAYGEKDLLRRTIATKKATTLDQLRVSAAKLKERTAKGGEAPAVKTSAAATRPAGRESAKFGGLTITYPVELKAAVGIVGPEYAKIVAKAHAAAEALCRKLPGPAAVDEATVKEDVAALRAYGIEPDADAIREVVMMMDIMRDGTQISRWFYSGDRMQIWIREDLLSSLKQGVTMPGFSLAPDGEGIGWSFKFSFPKKKGADAQPPPAGPSDLRANILKRIDAIPHPEYPIVLKRGSLPENLDDPVRVAAAIRTGEAKMFSMVREAAESPEKAPGELAAFSHLFSPEQAWFLVAHEVTEAAIVDSAIRSADRRWFCNGLGNWVAIRDVDRRFGPGKGAEAFAKSFNAAESRKHAGKVDLLAWPTAEDVEHKLRPEVENSDAYYYFATLAMEKALEGRGADFIKKWLDEIRKTPLNRANAGTVLAAYRKLTGQDLKPIMSEVVKEEVPASSPQSGK